MRDFREYRIWIEAMEIVKFTYSDKFNFPNSESFVLKSQICRSAISIPSNIAEGSSRSSEKEFCRFLEISLGSAFEFETQLIISKDLKYIRKDDFDLLIEKLHSLQKQINYFITKIKNNSR